MSVDAIERIAAFCRKTQTAYLQNQPLSEHCTFKIGGAAALFCMPETPEQLCGVVACCREQKTAYLILGKGSNVLFSDEGYRGVVISTLRLCAYSFQKDMVTVQAGATLSELCKAAAQKGLSGLEFAYGIPGTVGGAVFMNAGAYGGEIKNVLYSASYLDSAGKICSVDAAQLALCYRHSALQENGGILLKATFTLKKSHSETVWTAMRDFAARRVEKQPLDKPSAGSTFKRPAGAFAGALIDQCGLRGYRVGDAAVSEKHCGFVVNLGNATCHDVLQLTENIAQIVKEKTGYQLEKEVQVVAPEA